MNINDLVTQYVAFRRTLGERCNTTENILRSFCRAVGPQTPVTRIRREVVAAIPGRHRSHHQDVALQYCALKGFFQFAVSRGHLDKAPLADGTCPSALPRSSRTSTRVKKFAACWTRSRRVHASHVPIEPPTLRAILLLVYGAGLRRGEVLSLSVGRRRFGEFPAHHPRYQVLQIPSGPHRSGI